MKTSVRILSTLPALPVNNTLTAVIVRPGFLTLEQCIEVRRLTGQQPMQQGVTGAPVDGLRDSSVTWLQPSPGTDWLFNRLEVALMEANRKYRFDLQGFYEGAQIASYQPGGHYGWHMDIGADRYSNRKLSMSIQLSEPADYGGGELEFRSPNVPPCRDVGTLIVFPSYLEHRVRPVTFGTRLSLVSWVAGPPFK